MHSLRTRVSSSQRSPAAQATALGQPASQSRRGCVTARRQTQKCQAKGSSASFDAEDDVLFTNEFDAYEEFDEEGERKTLAQQGVDWRRNAVAERERRAAAEAARAEAVAASGLMSSAVMRAAMEAQQRAAKEAELKLQQEYAPSSLIEQLANEGIDLEADWAALEASKTPRSTTAAAKERQEQRGLQEGMSGRAGTPDNVLIRPPTTPKIEAMRREVKQMRERKRLWGLDSYDSAGSSGSSDDEDTSTLQAPRPPTSTSGSGSLSQLDVETLRAQRAANLLQNAAKVVDRVGLDGLRDTLGGGAQRRQSAVSSRPSSAPGAAGTSHSSTFGLDMFADDGDAVADDFDLEQQIAALEREQAANNRKQVRDRDDVLADRVVDHISQVFKVTKDVPTLQRPSAAPKPGTRPSARSSTQSVSRPSGSATRSAPQVEQDEEDALIALLEQLPAPRSPPQLARRPSTPTTQLSTSSQPSPASTNTAAGSLSAATASAWTPSVPITKQQDDLDVMFGDLFSTGKQAAQQPTLAARPTKAGPRASTTAAPVSVPSASEPQQTPTSVQEEEADDEEALFERMYAEAAAKAQAAKQATSGFVLAKPTAASLPEPQAPMAPSRPAAPAPPIPVPPQQAAGVSRPALSEEEEFERLYAEATRKVTASKASPPATARTVVPLSIPEAPRVKPQLASKPSKPTQQTRKQTPSTTTAPASPQPQRARQPAPAKARQPTPAKARQPTPAKARQPTPTKARQPTPTKARQPTPTKVKKPTPGLESPRRKSPRPVGQHTPQAVRTASGRRSDGATSPVAAHGPDMLSSTADTPSLHTPARSAQKQQRPARQVTASAPPPQPRTPVEWPEPAAQSAAAKPQLTRPAVASRSTAGSPTPLRTPSSTKTSRTVPRPPTAAGVDAAPNTRKTAAAAPRQVPVRQPAVAAPVPAQPLQLQPDDWDRLLLQQQADWDDLDWELGVETWSKQK